MSTTFTDDWLTTEQLADELRVAKNTVISWRYQKTGPKYSKVGPRLVRYRRSDVLAWMADNQE